MTSTATLELPASAAARTPAPQRLGTDLSNRKGMTADQVISSAQLGGWRVRKMPAYSTDIHPDTGETYTEEIDGAYGVWRDNPRTGSRQLLVKGTVGSVWDPYQNEEMVDFLDALTGSSGASFTAAGELRDGRDVFVSMQLPEGLLVGGVDPVSLFLTAFNNHTGKRALTLAIGGMRVWCANQQNIVIRNAQSVFKIRHTTGMRDGALAAARESLELSFRYVDALREEADRMINAPYSDAEFEQFIIEVCGTADEIKDPTPAKIKALDEETGALRHLFRDADTQANIRNTRWGAYQAFTEYLDWKVPVRSRKLDADDVRALRAFDGTYAEQKQYAYDMLRVG